MEDNQTLKNKIDIILKENNNLDEIHNIVKNLDDKFVENVDDIKKFYLFEVDGETNSLNGFYYHIFDYSIINAPFNITKNDINKILNDYKHFKLFDELDTFETIRVMTELIDDEFLIEQFNKNQQNLLKKSHNSMNIFFYDLLSLNNWHIPINIIQFYLKNKEHFKQVDYFGNNLLHHFFKNISYNFSYKSSVDGKFVYDKINLKIMEKTINDIFIHDYEFLLLKNKFYKTPFDLMVENNENNNNEEALYVISKFVDNGF